MRHTPPDQAASPKHPAFERLVKLLTVKQGFQFFILVCPDPRERDRLIGQLAATPEIAERPTLRIDLAEQGSAASAPADVSTLEDRLQTEAGENGLVHLVNGDGWLNPDRLAELNLHRNALAARVNAALLWWLPEPTVVSLAKTAPDLWSWRTAVVAFEPAPASELPTLQPDALQPIGFLVLQQMPQQLREARIAELQGMVGAVGDPEQRLALVLEWADLLISLGQLSEALIVLRTDGLASAANAHQENARALVQGRIADILTTRGELDEALRIRTEDQLPVYERLGDVRAKAITQGKIADILTARGQLDEALRIHTEEALPVYERLGDVREKAITQGKIADILTTRGEFDEALRIHTEEELPVYERLGDVLSKAVTQGQIADILTARGQLDEALRIHTEEALPVYERLGDVLSKAVTQGKIADILTACGQLDEALRIRTEEELPVFERLGDVRSLLIGRANLAINLLERAAPGDHTEARRLLMLALDDARRFKLPREIHSIEAMLARIDSSE